MRIVIIALFVLGFCLAEDDFNVYDAKGKLLNQISSLDDMTKNSYERKKVFVALKKTFRVNEKKYKKKNYVKSKGRTRWYELDLNENMKLCPEKNFNSGEGSWLVNGPAYIDSKNCVFIDGSPYTRSVLVLFAKNENDLSDADSSWLLINQTIVRLSSRTHRIWSSQQYNSAAYDESQNFKYESFKYDLIVDKTEFTVREAKALTLDYCKKDACEFKVNKALYSSQNIDKILDYPVIVKSKNSVIEYATWRSERDRLRSVFVTIPIDSVASGGVVYKSIKYKKKMILDDLEDGYRIPFESEWQALQSGGQETNYFWGNDSLLLDRYAWRLDDSYNGKVRAVAQLDANPYGLYDVYGNVDELVYENHNGKIESISECAGFSLSYSLSPACRLQKKIRSSRVSSRKSVCINGTCSPYVYRGSTGFRFVRRLE